MAKIILLSAFYSQLEYLTIGTPVPGCHWLWCLFFSPCIFQLLSISKLPQNRREGLWAAVLLWISLSQRRGSKQPRIVRALLGLWKKANTAVVMRVICKVEPLPAGSEQSWAKLTWWAVTEQTSLHRQNVVVQTSRGAPCGVKWMCLLGNFGVWASSPRCWVLPAAAPVRSARPWRLQQRRVCLQGLLDRTGTTAGAQSPLQPCSCPQWQFITHSHPHTKGQIFYYFLIYF